MDLLLVGSVLLLVSAPSESVHDSQSQELPFGRMLAAIYGQRSGGIPMLKQNIEIVIDSIFHNVGCDDNNRTICECHENVTATIYQVLAWEKSDKLERNDFADASAILLYVITSDHHNGDCFMDRSAGIDQYVGWLHDGDKTSTETDNHTGDGGAEQGHSVLEARVHVLLESLEELYDEEHQDAGEIVDADHESHIYEHDGRDEGEGGFTMCFGPADVLADVTNKDGDLAYSQVSLSIIDYLYRGYLPDPHCTALLRLPKASEFISSLLSYIDVSSEEKFGIHELGLLLTQLGIGEHSGADPQGQPEDDGHDHKKRKRRSPLPSRRLKRTAHDQHESAQTNKTQQCYSAGELMLIHGVGDDEHITLTEFERMCPALLDQQLSGACQSDNDLVTTPAQQITTAEKYGYGVLAVFIICLASLLGLALASCFKTRGFKYILSFLTAMAVGTLSGDAFLHLLPQAFNLHLHAGHAGGEGGFRVEFMDYTAKALAVLAAIFLFFLLESLLEMGRGSKSSEENYVPTVSSADIPMNGTSKGSSSNLQLTAQYSEADSGNLDFKDNDRALYCGARPVAMMVILGDAIHNLADGLAIGAAFSHSLGGGISTSVAVLCHELPHELGDFAILLKAGMTIKQAALFNFLSAAAAFIGLFIGFAVTSNEGARVWIFTATAGMFVYIALADMIPELIQMQKTKQKFVMLVVQLLGFLFGVALLVVIGLFEESIVVNV